MGTSDVVRVGLSGLGRFGKLHAAVLGALPGVEIAAVCDPRADEVSAMLARHPGARGFSDYDEMLEQSALDVAFIVSPEPLHAGQALRAIARGIAVFVEKPLAMAADEAEQVAAAARDAGLPLQVGFVLRFDVQHILLKTEIASGGLGGLISLRTKRNVSRAWFPDFGDRAHPIQETAIHDVDLLLWYAGSPVVRVQAVERNLSGMRYPDACWALLEFASGAVGIVETSWFVPAGAPANVVTPAWRGTIDAEIEVIGAEATSRIRLLDGPFSQWTADFTAVPETGMWPAMGGAVAGALREEDAHFIARVRGSLPESTSSVADAIAGLRIGEAIVASANSRMAIDLDPAG